MDFPQLIGGSYTLFSTTAEIEQTINLYLETIESQSGRNQYALYQNPGLIPYLNARPPASSSCRALLVLAGDDGDHVFDLQGEVVYEAFRDGTRAAIPGVAVADDRGPASTALNFQSLFLVSGKILYAVNSGAVTAPVTPFTPTAVACVGGYVVAIADSMAEFFFSLDGLTWDALNFQTAEGTPDHLVNCTGDHGQLWLFGVRSTQVYSVQNNAAQPFAADPAGYITTGLEAKFSLISLDNSLFWLGGNETGGGAVWRANGFTPTRISNHGVENAIRSYPRRDDAISTAYELNGHTTLQMTFPSANNGLGATWRYDISTGAWTEAAYRNLRTGLYERHRANFFVSAFEKILAGDYENGWLYAMSPAFYTDFGYPIRWVRRAPHITKNGHYISYRRVDLFMQVGGGLTSPLWLNGYAHQRSQFVILLADQVGLGNVTADQAIVLQDIYDVIPYMPPAEYPSPDTMNALGFYPWGTTSVLSDGTVIGAPPTVQLRYSNDGGVTYGAPSSRGIGKAGSATKRMYWNRAGRARDRVFEYSGSNPVLTSIVQGTFDAVECLT